MLTSRLLFAGPGISPSGQNRNHHHQQTLHSPLNCSGSASPEISIESGALKITGGTGTGDIFWNISLNDAAGNNLARWYGSSRHARGRIDTSITPDMILTGGKDDLYVGMDTAANTSAFYFNGRLSRVISHGATPGNSIATVRIERSDRPTAGADAVYFDQLHPGPVDSTLPKLNYMRDAGQITFSWPAVRRGAILESTVNPGPPSTWTPLAEGLTNGQFTHTAHIIPPKRFYRLRRP